MLVFGEFNGTHEKFEEIERRPRLGPFSCVGD